MIVISKRLFHLVMGFNTTIEAIDSENIIYKKDGISNYFKIPIYDFYFKCKFWAVALKYDINESWWNSDRESNPDLRTGTPLFDMRLLGVEKGYESRGVVCLSEKDHKQTQEYYFDVFFEFCNTIADFEV